MGSTSPLLLIFFFLLLPAINGDSADTAALLTLKSEIDPSNSLQWNPHSALCSSWTGVRECNPAGRVTKLVLELLNLTGTLNPQTLAPLDQIRVLSFKSNSLFGPIPDLSPLLNLKSLYLNSNRFSGTIPPSLAALHRLKIVDLADNLISGEIPAIFARIPRLYVLLLQDNRLSGQIPSFDQPNLRFFNVSGNNLSGWIPATRTLLRFNQSSFLDAPGLCGAQIRKPCSQNPIFPPSTAPAQSISSTISSSPHRKNKKRVIGIAAGSVAAFAIVVVLLLALLVFTGKKKGKNEKSSSSSSTVGEVERAAATTGAAAAAAAAGSGIAGGKREFSWENEGLGKLVFCGGVVEMYSLEDLLKASAETMGRGTVGSTYKAVMETGFIVTVKRLKDGGGLGVEEFRRRMEELGRLSHPNLVPLRAYFQAKEERLLVYDYFPNGSLFSLIHGIFSFTFSS